MKHFKGSLRQVLTGLVLLCGLMTSAQNKDSKGTDFWLVFNTNLNLPTTTLFIASETSTTGTVTVPGIGFATAFAVAANSVTPVVVPSTVASHANDAIGNLGIRVTAANEVTVYGLNYAPFTTDAFLGLPVDALGTDYMVMSYGGPNGFSEFGIVGTVNGTTVTITPRVSVGIHPANVPYSFVLNQGQTYELRSTQDLTGTVITATQPIGVTGANSCANIPPSALYCDHISEMLTSTDTWGKKFAAVPLRGRINGDTWRFLASENNTAISINGTLQATINRGQFYETIITAQSIIESDKPILAAQFSNGSGFSGNPGDPFMMLIPPLEQFLSSYTVTTVSGYVSHYINVVAPNSIVGSLTLDGVPVPAAEFTAIGSSGFSGARLAVAPGAHTLNSTLPFGLFMYGFNADDSYGYPGGQSFSPIAVVSSISISPLSGSAGINNQQCFDALVQDQNSNPLQGVRVDFNITGPNSAASGFAFTNASGIAQFCYTGTNAGQDNIEARVGTLTANATFNWTSGCAATITVKKFYDLNTDGLDNDNMPVAQWQITLTGTDENSQAVGPIVQMTDANGIASFSGLINGSYTVTETVPAGWVSTTTATANVTVSSCTSPAQVNFGNVCLGAGGTGGGVGLWTNKNGQALITGAYLCALNNLCLRNGDGSHFDPVAGCPMPSTQQVNAGRTNLRNWMLAATATNMSYMLSSQFAALELNVLSGRIDPTKLVYAPGTNSANAAGFATINSLRMEADALLCAYGVTDAGHPQRARAEALKNAMEGANLNSNFVQAQPCNGSATTTVRGIESEVTTTHALLAVKVAPNPFSGQVSINVQGITSAEGISVRVMDVTGRVIEDRSKISSGVIVLGSNYKNGTYIVELRQGTVRQMIKLVKIN